MKRTLAMRRIVVGALLGTLAACTSWRVQGISPEMVLAREHPAAVRVVRTDSSVLIVSAPTVVRDTLRGEVDSGPVALPLSDVHTLAVRRGDGAKTAGLVFVVGVGSVLGLAALIAATW